MPRGGTYAAAGGMRLFRGGASHKPACRNVLDTFRNISEMSSVSEFVPSRAAGKAKTSWLSGRRKWILVAILAAVLAGAAWYFLGDMLESGHKTPPAPPVHVAAARRMNVTVIEHTIGTVVSPAMVQVNAQVQGYLLKAFFKEGQLVHKGDPLFLIDPAPFQNALAQAKAQLAKDQATAASDLNDERRYTALYAQNATSQQSRDQAVAAAQAAVATVQADKAAVATAELNLGYTHITSPIDGKTGPIVIQPGNLITVAGSTPLVTITQVQPIKVSFFLPQNQLQQIQNQMAAGKLIAIVPMAGAPGGSEKAKVDFISNTVGSSTGTIELRATFPNTDMRLVTGQSFNIGITLNQIPGAIVVPRDAVNVGPDSSYVYVVGKDMVVTQKSVKVLNDDGTNDAIEGDIKPGDKVVVDGQLRVVPGNKVRIVKGAPSNTVSPLDSDMPT